MSGETVSVRVGMSMCVCVCVGVGVGVGVLTVGHVSGVLLCIVFHIPPPLFCTNTFPHTHPHTNTYTHTPIHTHIYILSLSHTHIHNHPPTQTHPPTHPQTPFHLVCSRVQQPCQGGCLISYNSDCNMYVCDVWV